MTKRYSKERKEKIAEVREKIEREKGKREDSRGKYPCNKEIRIWDWIRHRCKEDGWYSASVVAEFVDRLYIEIWEGKSTSIWENNIKNMDYLWALTPYRPELLIVISEHVRFRVGCVGYGCKCDDCEMGKRYGFCDLPGSVIGLWKDTLIKEVESPIDVEVVWYLKVRFREFDKK